MEAVENKTLQTDKLQRVMNVLLTNAPKRADGITVNVCGVTDCSVDINIEVQEPKYRVLQSYAVGLADKFLSHGFDTELEDVDEQTRCLRVSTGKTDSDEDEPRKVTFLGGHRNGVCGRPFDMFLVQFSEDHGAGTDFLVLDLRHPEDKIDEGWGIPECGVPVVAISLSAMKDALLGGGTESLSADALSDLYYACDLRGDRFSYDFKSMQVEALNPEIWAYLVKLAHEDGE